MKIRLPFPAAPAQTTRSFSHVHTRRTCHRAALGLLAALATIASPARAAVTEAWVHRYNNVVTNANDQAHRVVRDAAGDLIVTGNTNDGITGPDMLTIKYSGADGSVLWQKRYTNGIPRALAVDASGNVVVTGSAENIDHTSDYYTAKYAAADGTLLWEKRYNGPGNSDDYAQALAVDGSGNVLVTGYSSGGESGYDYYTAKYAALDGTLLWEKRYNSPANSYDEAQAVAVDSSGNVVVTGSSVASGFAGDYYTAKYAAADGGLLWEKRYNGPGNSSDGASAVAVDGNGNVVVTGSSDAANFSNPDYYTAKYAAANGGLLWEKRYNGPANTYDKAQAVAVDGSGNVVVTGTSSGSGIGGDYYTAKYAAAGGALLWEKRYNSPANDHDFAKAVAVDGSGNVVVTGTSYGSGIGGDYYTAKYAAGDGALLWEKRYNGPANHYDQAQALAVDGNGNVVVTGSSAHGAPNYDTGYYTAKYAAANGGLLWERYQDGPANRPAYDEARGLAVDGGGNVVVTGVSGNGSIYQGYTSDYYTAKYAAADGVLLWEQRYHGGSASAVAVDGSGNVVVTGFSYNGTNDDYYTAKYAAADGSLLWEKRYNGPANRYGYANALAVDGSGNVVVSGTSDQDYFTAKYAAADGALLWEKRYNGPANSYDYARALAVDGSGNVVVTGYSYNSFGWFDTDYYTAKYAAANGALLWEHRYNSPSDFHDVASAVAVDGSGNVVVTGTSWIGNSVDNYTAKYAAANGALLWENRDSGPGSTAFDFGEAESAQAVAVDGSGNVVVTGNSHGTNGNTDYYTAKHAAADGALLWARRYNGAGNGNDRVQAVAVDGSGNVLVTGSAENIDHTSDYYTAKYAAADGALLWEKRYNGPGNGNDNASSLALGPNGMVAVTGSSFYDYATIVYRDTPPPLSFAAWAACSSLSGAAAAAGADPDSDGLPNGAEYILGGNPIVPATSGSPTATTTSGGNIILTFPRDDASETPDVNLTVETGTVLLTWPTVFHIGPSTAASSPGVSISENGAAPDTVTVTIPQGKPTSFFARLKVTIAP